MNSLNHAKDRILGLLIAFLLLAGAPVAAQGLRDENRTGKEESSYLAILSRNGHDVARFEAFDVSLPQAHELSRIHTYGNITLKRGYVDDSALIDWLLRARPEDAGRDDVSIRFVSTSPDGYPTTTTWEFDQAWISKWKGFSLDGKGTDVAVEELELNHEGFVIR